MNKVDANFGCAFGISGGFARLLKQTNLKSPDNRGTERSVKSVA